MCLRIVSCMRHSCTYLYEHVHTYNLHAYIRAHTFTLSCPFSERIISSKLLTQTCTQHTHTCTHTHTHSLSAVCSPKALHPFIHTYMNTYIHTHTVACPPKALHPPTLSHQASRDSDSALSNQNSATPALSDIVCRPNESVSIRSLLFLVFRMCVCLPA